jgi:hypothetical protein
MSNTARTGFVAFGVAGIVFAAFLAVILRNHSKKSSPSDQFAFEPSPPTPSPAPKRNQQIAKKSEHDGEDDHVEARRSPKIEMPDVRLPPVESNPATKPSPKITSAPETKIPSKPDPAKQPVADEQPKLPKAPSVEQERKADLE